MLSGTLYIFYLAYSSFLICLIIFFYLSNLSFYYLRIFISFLDMGLASYRSPNSILLSLYTLIGVLNNMTSEILSTLGGVTPRYASEAVGFYHAMLPMMSRSTVNFLYKFIKSPRSFILVLIRCYISSGSCIIHHPYILS